MTTHTQRAQPEVPSTRKILAATGGALAVATVLLVLFVLPAEYGIDPLGTGKALGLTALVGSPEKAAVVAAANKAAPDADAGNAAAESAPVSIAPVLVPSPSGDAPLVKNTFLAQPGRFQFDSRELEVPPLEGLEIKYNMKKGAGLVYSWTASNTLSFEFHGEPNVKPAGKEGTDYYETYELDEAGKKEGHGTFLAPSSGIHGWFWNNKSTEPVKLKLVTAGFYNWILTNIDDKQTALKTMDAYAVPGHPTVPDQPSR